jgi:hypothetical protein
MDHITQLHQQCVYTSGHSYTGMTRNFKISIFIENTLKKVRMKDGHAYLPDTNSYHSPVYLQDTELARCTESLTHLQHVNLVTSNVPLQLTSVL